MPWAAVAAVGSVIGAGAAVVGTINSAKAANRANAATQESMKYQRQMDNYKAARERVQAIRSARLAAGTSLQSAANQGAMNTSASIGSMGSIASQLNSNLSFLDTNNKLSDMASQKLGEAAQHRASAELWGSIAGAGSSLFNISGGVGAIKTGFGIK